MTARELQRQTEKSMKFHITEALQRLSNRREYGRLGTRGAGIEAHGVDWRGCGGTKPMRDGDWGLGVGDWGLGIGGGGAGVRVTERSQCGTGIGDWELRIGGPGLAARAAERLTERSQFRRLRRLRWAGRLLCGGRGVL